MASLISAQGAIFERILRTAHGARSEGLSDSAFRTFHAAHSRTAWALRHQRRCALVEGGTLLASAQRYDLAGVLNGQTVRVCGIGDVFVDPEFGDDSHIRTLLEQLLNEAERDGADVALLVATPAMTSFVLEGFERVATLDAEVKVTESSRHGAPMTLVRGGEDRDLAAIVAMGRVRAHPFRFHLDRDVDYVKHAITKKRLLAGLAPSGARELQFVIAEEGITAAAYVVLTVVGQTWTIEECGDRDPSGARVGALLQALIARAPVEQRPIIRGWLPSGFVPPQIAIVSTCSAAEVLMVRLRSAHGGPLSTADVLYWHGDVFL